MNGWTVVEIVAWALAGGIGIYLTAQWWKGGSR